MRILLLTILSAAVCYCGTFAQNKNDQAESKSGYRGGFIKGLKVTDDALNFIVVGDWGRQGDYFQKQVANQMTNAAVGLNADFIISTGDNFYPNGVASVTDPLWQSSFENVYNSYHLQNKWYVVLGNHDYRSNPQAQVDYSLISSRWQMPSRYYSMKVAINDDTTNQALFVFVDTNPFVTKYYTDGVYAPRVKSVDTTAQLLWLDSVLSNTSKNIKWKVVVGHHPLYTGGKRIKSKDTKDVNATFKSLFDKYAVDIYLCGHEHHLEYIKPVGPTHYFISGAGSEVRPVSKFPIYGIFAAAEAGFMTFSITKNSFVTNTINDKGKIIYTTTIKK